MMPEQYPQPVNQFSLLLSRAHVRGVCVCVCVFFLSALLPSHAQWVHVRGPLLSTCRRAHREEITKLQQQLKTASMSSKGGQVESERLKKDLEKTRCAEDSHPIQIGFFPHLNVNPPSDAFPKLSGMILPMFYDLFTPFYCRAREYMHSADGVC
jgi:hypothetical protein